MKIYVKRFGVGVNVDFLNPPTIESQIRKYKLTRSCPTGFDNEELSRTSTLELLHLRKSVYEYLNFKSVKTRNIQFIALVKRINEELERRNVKVPISITLHKKCRKLNKIKAEEQELINEIDMLLSKGEAEEHCYLLKKRNFDRGNTEFDQAALISTKHFSIKSSKKLNVPDFLQDSIHNPKTSLGNCNSMFSSMVPIGNDQHHRTKKNKTFSGHANDNTWFTSSSSDAVFSASDLEQPEFTIDIS